LPITSASTTISRPINQKQNKNHPQSLWKRRNYPYKRKREVNRSPGRRAARRAKGSKLQRKGSWKRKKKSSYRRRQMRSC